jgi:protein O-mannosyl-transferase
MSSGWIRFAVCGVIIALTWAVFGQTLGHEFINLDDPFYVSENPNIQNGLNWGSIVWAFTHVHANNWHPLTTMSHMLDWQLFGLRPGWHHLVNVLLHSANAVLLFLLLIKINPPRIWSSAFVAAVFAVHPLRVESVAWISERKDLLSGLFFMLTLLAYFRYARKPTVARYVTMSILFACGLMSKPMLITLPIVLLLLDYWPLGRFQKTGARKLFLEKVPLVVLSLGSAAATLFAQSQEIGLVRLEVLPFWWRVTNALSALLIYIWQIIWPSDLALFYSHPGRLPLWQVAGAAILLTAITAGVIALRKQKPYLMVGWSWYVIVLLPVIGLIQVGGQSHADRYTYLPQIGLYIAITWGIVDLARFRRYAVAILGAAAGIIITALSYGAAKQTWYWHDSERLWRHVLAVTTGNDVAHLCLGDLFLDQKRVDAAIAEFQSIVARHPNDAGARLKLANALSEKKDRINEAIAEFEAASRIGDPNLDVETTLANLLLGQGRIDEAIKYYRHVVRLNPSGALAHYNLAVGLHRLGQLPEAIAQYKEALAIDPKYPDAQYFLEQAESENGQEENKR